MASTNRRGGLRERVIPLFAGLGVAALIGGAALWSTLLTTAHPGTIAVPGGSATTADPRAVELLRKVAASLDACAALDVAVASEHRAGEGDESDLRETATAESSFRRGYPAWRIAGKTAPISPGDPGSGAKYELLSDPKRTTVAIAVVQGGKPVPYADLLAGLEALSGVTRRTANVLPDLVLTAPYEEERWNPSRHRLLDFLAERATILPDEALGPNPCYRVRSEHEIGTWIVWIDRKLLLPRRIDLARSEQQLDRYLGRARSFRTMGTTHRLKYSRVP